MAYISFKGAIKLNFSVFSVLDSKCELDKCKILKFKNTLSRLEVIVMDWTFISAGR